MQAISHTAIYETDPDGILLDLSELHYEWGDLIELVLSGLGERFYISEQLSAENEPLFKRVSLPQATLVGSDCKEAISTLLYDTKKPIEPYQWLFEDFDLAWDYIEQKITQEKQKTI